MVNARIAKIIKQITQDAKARAEINNSINSHPIGLKPGWAKTRSYSQVEELGLLANTIKRFACGLPHRSVETDLSDRGITRTVGEAAEILFALQFVVPFRGMRAL